MSIAVEPENLIGEGKQGWITPQGIFYRKGTSLATFANAIQYQDAIDRGECTTGSALLRGAVNDQRFITNMMAFGIFFEFFPPEDWFSDHRHEGRMMPALLLLQQFPDRMTLSCEDRLKQLRSAVSRATRELIDETLETKKQFNLGLIKTKSQLEKLSTLFLDAIADGNIDKAMTFWCTAPTGTFVCAASGIVERRIVEVKARLQTLPLAEKSIAVKHFASDIDLPRGTATLVTSVSTSSGASYVFEFQYTITTRPSCISIMEGASNDWRTGNWVISSLSQASG